jgi:hypothetical protein
MCNGDSVGGTTGIGFSMQTIVKQNKRSPALRAGSHFCRNDRLKAEFKKLQTDRMA